jgi:hypothetical protein
VLALFATKHSLLVLGSDTCRQPPIFAEKAARRRARGRATSVRAPAPITGPPAVAVYVRREGYLWVRTGRDYGVTTENVPKGVLMLAPWASPEVMSWLKKYSG